MTAIFLQVRLDSTRLPGKALLPLVDRTVIEHAMRALNLVPADVRQLLTTDDSVDELVPLAEKCAWGVFVGSKDDVLERFILAARECGADRLIRATGDNPLVSAMMARSALELSQNSAAAYSGYTGLPIGSGVEVISVEKLEEAYLEAVDPYEREHVSPFLYHRPERFSLALPKAASEFCAPEARITLDTSEDYKFLQRLYDNLYCGDVLDLDRVVPYLKSTELKQTERRAV